MKKQFKNYISKDDDDCCFHGFNYAFSRHYVNRENQNENGCKFPFFVCEYLKQLLINNHFIENDREHIRKDAVKVIDGISENFNCT